MQLVDMYPTYAGLAGAKLGKNMPLDGMDMWPMLPADQPPPRTGFVRNIEPMPALD